MIERPGHRAGSAFGIRLRAAGSEFWVAFGFLVLGLFVAAYCRATLEMFASYGPGPGFAPVVTGLGLAGVAGWRVLALWRAGPAGREATDGATDREPLRRAVLLILAVSVTLPLMDWLGSTVALTILSFVMMRGIQRDPLTISVATSLLMPAALVWLFRTPLSIPLPRGIFF
jgi:hypothetical protein